MSVQNSRPNHFLVARSGQTFSPAATLFDIRTCLDEAKELLIMQ